MDEIIIAEPDLFEHREVKPHFINPCCFGEDFAAWLIERLSPLVDVGFCFRPLSKKTMAGVFGPGIAKIPSG